MEEDVPFRGLFWESSELKTKFILFTIELGPGQDAPTDGEAVFPIADMEG